MSFRITLASCNEFKPTYRTLLMQSRNETQGIAFRLSIHCLQEGHFIFSETSCRSRLIFFEHLGQRIIKSSPRHALPCLAKPRPASPRPAASRIISYACFKTCLALYSAYCFLMCFNSRGQQSSQTPEVSDLSESGSFSPYFRSP